MKSLLSLALIASTIYFASSENAEARRDRPATKTSLTSCTTLNNRLQNICQARHQEGANSKAGDTSELDLCLRNEAARLIAGASAQKRCRFSSDNHSIVAK